MSATPTESLNRFTQASVESAGKLAAISMQSAQRAIALQLGFARQALDQASLDVHALANAKDVKELVALRARVAGRALESWVGYSQGLMAVASQARAEIGKLAEERMGTMREALADAGPKRGTTKRRRK